MYLTSFDKLQICQIAKPRSHRYFLLNCKLAGGGSLGRYSAFSGGQGKAKPAWTGSNTT